MLLINQLEERKMENDMVKDIVKHVHQDFDRLAKNKEVPKHLIFSRLTMLRFKNEVIDYYAWELSQALTNE